jgi:DNA-binding transcriptional ArsR family regulator
MENHTAQEKRLEEICAKLDRIILLLETSLRQEFSATAERILKSESKREIFELCDGKRTVKEVARILNKTLPNVSMQLGEMEKAGLIRSRQVGRERFYFKVVDL